MQTLQPNTLRTEEDEELEAFGKKQMRIIQYPTVS